MLLLSNLERKLLNTRESLASLQDGSVDILFNSENVLCGGAHEYVGAHM